MCLCYVCRVHCDSWNTQWPMAIKSDDVTCFDSTEQYRLNGVQMISSSSSLNTSPYAEHHLLLHRDVIGNCWRNGELDERSRLANIDRDYVTRFSQQKGDMTGHAPFTEIATTGYRLPPVCTVSISREQIACLLNVCFGDFRHLFSTCLGLLSDLLGVPRH